VKLVVQSPLEGWAMPLTEVPDEVFAAAMAGDGVAIDPTGDTVCAPFDGEIVPVGMARHAVTVRSASGVEVLVHVGIDTVALNGVGFEWLARAGDRVAAGAPLLRFDLDAVARRAKSLATPIVLAGGGIIGERVAHRRVGIGDTIFEVDVMKRGKPREEEPVSGASRMRVPFDHGLHVRPAALVAAALKPFTCEVEIVLHGRAANARSGVALMGLGARCGDVVEVRARGADARAALEALASVLAPELADAVVVAEIAKKQVSTPTGRIPAVIASRGFSVGTVARLTQADGPVEEKGRTPADEERALEQALARLQSHLEASAKSTEGMRRELLEAHAGLVRDPELARVAAEHIRTGKSAGFAWREATRATASALADMDDERMRERAADLRDLERQVLRVLRGEEPASVRQLAPGSILVADDMLPSQFIALDVSRIAGLCLACGGATSHVSILAASGGIPSLVAAGASVLDVTDGSAAILDAEQGWIHFDPPAAELDAARRAMEQRIAESDADLAQARAPAITRDGVTIAVKANAGSIADARSAMQHGADGCGLLRTEFLFLDRRLPPDEDEQAAEYERIALAFGGHPVNIRTLDIGGDKPIAYLPLPREENPALGLRGVRTSLAYPELLRTQLRAIARAAAKSRCRILVPMVNELAELQQVREMAAQCARDVGAETPPVGVMIETPAAALGAHELARHADFLSIGSNDLAQYALAIDRGHADLARHLDALHPAVLLLIAATVEGAQANGRTVSVCGAMASDAQALRVLVGLGVQEISATPAAIARLKRIARSLDTRECRKLAGRALDAASAHAVRELLR
jgi:phosphoenolpyruvate-protein phosphotransferase